MAALQRQIPSINSSNVTCQRSSSSLGCKRQGLFSFCQACIPIMHLIVSPVPFYFVAARAGYHFIPFFVLVPCRKVTRKRLLPGHLRHPTNGRAQRFHASMQQVAKNGSCHWYRLGAKAMSEKPSGTSTSNVAKYAATFGLFKMSVSRSSVIMPSPNSSIALKNVSSFLTYSAFFCKFSATIFSASLCAASKVSSTHQKIRLNKCEPWVKIQRAVIWRHQCNNTLPVTRLTSLRLSTLVLIAQPAEQLNVLLIRAPVEFM